MKLGSSVNFISGFVLQFNDSTAMPEPTKSEFTTKKQCLIKQYSEYQEPDMAENLDGERTFVENFADNTGIKLAYRAYRKWSEKFSQKRDKLIGLEYTWDQLFWLSASHTWCGVYRKGIKPVNIFLISLRLETLTFHLQKKLQERY